MSHDCHSRLSGRLGRLAEERIFLKEEGFWTSQKDIMAGEIWSYL
jgi:hypothetical protein